MKNNAYKRFKKPPDHLWLERKSELDTIVRKNMVGYSILNSFIVLSFLGFNYKLLGFKFPTITFLGFLGVNVFLGFLGRSFVLSKGHKGRISSKNQYLVLMVWQNIAMVIIMLWPIGFAITGWLTPDAITLPIYWLAVFIIFGIIVFIYWSPRKKYLI